MTEFQGNSFARIVERTLEDGLDLGIYKAILVGQLGQVPIQKKLKSGKIVTLLFWHRVSVYPERLGDLAAKNFVPGPILYVEGNLESKAFNDPITGLVRRIQEVAVRRQCVVDIISGRPLIVEPYLAQIEALVVAWILGAEGQGVADLLFGDYSFMGKLISAWFKSVKQLPMNVEDPHYDPLFSFGFGLTSDN
ncbi:single-stranded DNA-binding protein [Striga asiatica]|uniref:beta-glucosidase n=1 Tax=Striga asiatica TaxID=4170 RepID=A0A5A7RE34_STRAF|nr:single-stranded DNA-binding protein [Striga asiatica]